MKDREIKERICVDNPELILCENGDFSIKKELIENYEIIDMHCHLYKGLSQLFPPVLRKEIVDLNKSLMDLSCFPFSMEQFDLDQIYFTKCPTQLFSKDGLKTRIKLYSGALVLNYATGERLISDMNQNGILEKVQKPVLVQKTMIMGNGQVK